MESTQLACCTICIRDLAWDRALDVVAASGFRRVELLGRMPHLSLDPAELDPALIKAGAAARGLTISNLGTYVGRGFASDDPVALEAELAQVRRAVDVAAFLGASTIRVALGNDKAEILDHLVPWFQRSAAYAEQHGIYLCFETHGGGISGVPAMCKLLCEKVGSPFFGVLYDPCNILHAGWDYRMALWTFRSWVRHVHFKDGAVDRDGFELRMLGAGQVDLRWVVDYLAAWGYNGGMSLEYELSSPPPAIGMKRWLETARSILGS